MFERKLLTKLSRCAWKALNLYLTQAAPDDHAKAGAISIISQCIYCALASTVIRKISADSAFTEDNFDQLADSVWLFSFGGIARIKEENFLPSKAEI